MISQVKSEALGWLDLIHGDSSAFEIRILVPSTDPKWPRPTIWSGIYNDSGKAYDDLVAFKQAWSACYFTINETNLPVTNSLKRKTKEVVCTSDSDVTHRKWVWIDIDPIRYEEGLWVDSKRPSNSDELTFAESTARDIARFLSNRGFPEPILACSGNGYHLLWRCESGYPTDDSSYRRMLSEVALRFNSAKIDIDMTVDSPGQLCKTYGTLARKGESSESRKFRFSKIISVPEEISTVSVDLVSKAFTGNRPKSIFKWNKKGVKEESPLSWPDDDQSIKIDSRTGLSSDFTVNDEFDPIKKVESWGYQLGNPVDKGEYKFHPFKVCACDRKLKDESNGLYVRKDGAVAYRCFHNSCDYSCGDKENKWSLLRSKHEPVVSREKREVTTLALAKYTVEDLNSDLLGLNDTSSSRDSLDDFDFGDGDVDDDLEYHSPNKEPESDDISQDFGPPLVSAISSIGGTPTSSRKKSNNISKILSIIDSDDDEDIFDIPNQKKPDNSDISGLGDEDLDFADSLSLGNGEISVAKRPRSTKIIRAKDGRRVVDTKSDPADIYQHVVDEISALPDVFINGGRLAHVNKAHGSIIEMVRGYLDRVTFQSCEFVSFKRVKDRVISEVSPVSPRILDSILEPSESDRAKFKEILSVAKYPFFDKDGELVTDVGYNKKAKVYLCETVPLDMDSIENPFSVLEDLISDFPFGSDAEKQNYLAAWIVPMIRSMIDGPMPLLLLDGNKRGIGKTKLGHIIQATYGLMPEAADLPKEEDEMEKKIVSTLREGIPVFMFDNIKHMITSSVLDRILTSESYSGRLLSKNLNLHMQIIALFILSVNNMKSGEDLSRRVSRARLVTDMSRPERRTGYKYPHIVRHVKNNRPQILSAIAKIVTQWIEAGMPRDPEVPIIGSFESWCDIIGSIMFFHGKKKWMSNVEDTVQDATLVDEWEAFTIAWYNELGSEVNLHKLVDLAKRKRMLGNIVSGDEGKQTWSMRSALIERKDSIIGNFKLTVRRDSHSKTDKYRLTECVTPIKPTQRKPYIEVPDEDYEFG